jgi:hypothetical protein
VLLHLVHEQLFTETRAVLNTEILLMNPMAANKALICWCSDAKHRDTVVKVADVGFLGLLGSLSLAAAWSPAGALSVAQPLILQMGFSHILLEMLFNGIAIPAMCASVVDEREVHHDGQARSLRQEILEKAAARSVAKNKTGLPSPCSFLSAIPESQAWRFGAKRQDRSARRAEDAIGGG